MNAESNLTLDYFNDASALIYGIGNIGRQDDGLGWEFIDWLEATSACPKAEKVKFYHLNLEDADLISHKQRVLFIDASKDTTLDSFRLYKAEPKMDFSFTSHTMSIETVMATCQQVFENIPEVYVLAIRGYEWELQLGLTEQAKKNLDHATSQLGRAALERSPITDNRLPTPMLARAFS
ncbi:MAG: hydrogenase maturation protease [Glaciimonas sp.]|nr:hydrogenase maturation protease [Glaciimonas sp.]